MQPGTPSPFLPFLFFIDDITTFLRLKFPCRACFTEGAIGDTEFCDTGGFTIGTGVPFMTGDGLGVATGVGVIITSLVFVTLIRITAILLKTL